MNKQLICALFASLAVFSVSGAPDEGKMDLGKVNPENGQPQGWVLNAVKLSKTPDPVPPVAAVKKEADGTAYLHLAGGNTTINHFYLPDFFPAAGGRTSIEFTFDVRPLTGGGIACGAYLFSGKKWLRTAFTNKWGLKKGEWQKVTVSMPIQAEFRGSPVDCVRPLLICGQKEKVDFRNIAWKIVPAK